MGPPQAIVRPRVASPETGDLVPLVEVVEPWLESHSHGALEIVGGPGMGKTTALTYLAQEILPDAYTVFIDDADLDDVVAKAAVQRVIFTSSASNGQIADVWLRLAPWGDDDRIEYLIAAHRKQCPSVMTRLGGDCGVLQGTPELWRMVLDGLAVDESAGDWRAVLWRLLEPKLVEDDPRRLAYDHCRSALCGGDVVEETTARELSMLGCDTELLRLLRHRAVRLLLASRDLVETLAAGVEPAWLPISTLPRDLLREAGGAIGNSPAALQTLDRLMKSNDPLISPRAASLLHATNTGWKPADGRGLRLSNADLHGATWRGIDLSESRLFKADLSGADLSEANLCKAEAFGAKFHSARLAKTCLMYAKATSCDFAGADLSHLRAHMANFDAADFTDSDLTDADLTCVSMRNAQLGSACFRRAAFCLAVLEGAVIEGADFTEANFRQAQLSRLPLRLATLTQASFKRAVLRDCDLEQVELADADFERADLTGAYLTASIMPRACFHGAMLRGAGMADVEWEGADLRDADLRQSSFFLGSTRCGLVGSPIASEGSRTGFYTDEYDEQPFKSPEEIRKANLRGADLRGAKVDGVDFYLVDLRDALFSPEQEIHFRRCGAILETRK
jgi:uncharacterized protein YjbI with pentapeptide repeats